MTQVQRRFIHPANRRIVGKVRQALTRCEKYRRIEVLQLFLCIFAFGALSGCRLDVTQKIDVTTPGREAITYRETFDNDAFAATTQLGGPYAFGFDAAKQDGWDVTGSSGPNRHTFIFRRSFSDNEDVGSQLTRLAYDSVAATPKDAFLLGPTAFIGVPITFSTATPKSLLIPALLRPSETVSKDGRKDAAFQRASARVNAAAIDSVVHVHLEIQDAAGIHRIEPSFAKVTTLTSSVTGLRVGNPWPIAPLLAFWREVGAYGVFDYEHYSPPLCKAEPKYQKSWMFGIGVFANGAEIPEQLLDNAATLANDWLAKHPVKCP